MCCLDNEQIPLNDLELYIGKNSRFADFRIMLMYIYVYVVLFETTILNMRSSFFENRLKKFAYLKVPSQQLCSETSECCPIFDYTNTPYSLLGTM